MGCSAWARACCSRFRPSGRTISPSRVSSLGSIRGRPSLTTSAWRQTLFGLDFPNPIGMAAGFDKNARVPRALLAMGFGFVEVGTLTPRPQSGNASPRLFRSMADRAIINRLGFNNEGQEAALAPAERPRAVGSSASISGPGATARTASATMCRASSAWRRWRAISPSTSPRPTRRACAISRRPRRSMHC